MRRDHRHDSGALTPTSTFWPALRFLNQSVCALEIGRTLGRGPWQSFFGIALPLARPALVGGMALALMEALSDFGTVQYYGVDTFTTGIYRTWFALGDASAAAQLAAMLLIFVAALLLGEQWSRGRARYHHTTNRYRPLPSYRLRGWPAAFACLACAIGAWPRIRRCPRHTTRCLDHRDLAGRRRCALRRIGLE